MNSFPSVGSVFESCIASWKHRNLKLISRIKTIYVKSCRGHFIVYCNSWYLIIKRKRLRTKKKNSFHPLFTRCRRKPRCWRKPVPPPEVRALLYRFLRELVLFFRNPVQLFQNQAQNRKLRILWRQIQFCQPVHKVQGWRLEFILHSWYLIYFFLYRLLRIIHKPWSVIIGNNSTECSWSIKRIHLFHFFKFQVGDTSEDVEDISTPTLESSQTSIVPVISTSKSGTASTEKSSDRQIIL